MIKKFKNELERIINVSKEYGIDYGLGYFSVKFLFRNDVRFSRQQSDYYGKICEYIKKKYIPLIRYDDKIECGKISAKSCFWVMWWQGEENMPPLVKATFKSIKNNAKDHRVVLITRENYEEYAHIPEYIKQKFRAGKITLAHLSDIIRFKLLYDFGGFWIDSTIFMRKPLEEEIYKYPVYTIKHDKAKPLCLGLWSAYFWGTAKNNPFFKYVYDIFCEYWKKEDYLIDYFLVDHAIKSAYDTIPDIKNMIDAIPKNNENVYYLEEHLNEPLEGFKFDNNTYIYKLSWKKKHKNAVNNVKTVYIGLLNDELQKDICSINYI